MYPNLFLNSLIVGDDPELLILLPPLSKCWLQITHIIPNLGDKFRSQYLDTVFRLPELLLLNLSAETGKVMYVC